MRATLLVVPVLCVLSAAAGENASTHLPQRGICVIPGDKQCSRALKLARQTDLTVFVQLAGADDVEAARRAADAAGMYGRRIFVAAGDLKRLHLADNVADVLLAPAGAMNVPQAEVLRVLRPGGQARLGEKTLTKPQPEGTDDWSHHYHGPDNNPQSNDRLARAPYLTQFIAEPRYAPAPQAAVASAGRVFMAFGHVAWHRREEPALNKLIAMNGFNGTVLWERALPPGIMVDRSTMIATPETLYLAGEKSCKLIDAASGEDTGEIVAPADLTGGTFWKWMALEDGVLYALVGQAEAPDAIARWRRQSHGWPWGGISNGYNQQQYRWGFARTLLAIDPKTKKVLWHHRESRPIDSRGLCMSNGRIYLCSFGEYLARLNARSGEEVWRRAAEKDAELFGQIGPYRPGHGFIAGWKSTVYLKCTDRAVYFVGPQVQWLTAVSAKDGSFLWRHQVKDLHVVIRDDGLYAIGSQRGPSDTKKLDPLSGQVLASYAIHRRACTRSTGGADGIFFRAPGGSVRLDLASGKGQWISPMRPSCHVGVIIANGQLYWVPWVCDCNLQMFGVICLGPAGDFDFDRKATDAERLETPGGKAEPARFEQSPADWPTYRANNARTAETAAEVPKEVDVLWQFKPQTGFEPTAPTAAGGMVFLGGSDGVVRALDAASGEVRWKAYTGGGVRYPPTIAAGRALVGSGDGWAYAFEAPTGRLLWRFRAAPVERRIPVYAALLSTWPVASGVLVEDQTAYFAAGINNFDGTSVYAVDAATGKLKWHNSASGRLDGFSRRGVAAQGDLLLHGGKLYLAGGNAASPGIFDLASGQCLTPPPRGMGSRAPRGRELLLAGDRVIVRGQPFYSTPSSPVYDNAVRWPNPTVTAKNARLLCAAGGGNGGTAWRLVARDAAEGETLWEQPLPAEPVRWGVAVDARGRIIVTLRNGHVLCLGPKRPGGG